MADSSKCHICSASATVHLTQILNNQVHKIDLCEACAQKKGVLNDDGFSLSNLIGKTLDPALASEACDKLLKCTSCGLSVSQLKKTGRLGCAQCYENLATVIHTVIKNLHKDNLHKGKVPSQQIKAKKTPKDILPAPKNVEQIVLQLHEQIKQAIKEERYEDAARYRDEIAKIKK